MLRIISIALVLAAACAFGLPAPSACAAEKTLSPQEIRRHLDEGEELFRQAMDLDRTDPEAARDCYRRVILHFEVLIAEGGVSNGRLFYNLGNSYFRLGDVGRAILNYKRASRYIANDSNLRQNLAYARSRRADRIEQMERRRVFKTLFFIHYDVPSRIRFIIFAAVFAAVWVSAALMLVTRLPGLRAVLAVASVVSGLLLISLVVEAVDSAHRPEGVITAGETIARMGDAESYQPSFREPLHAGTEFRLLERRSGWWRIELESGDRCWISAPDGELVTD